MRARGRCSACYAYLLNNGIERPERLWSRQFGARPLLFTAMDVAWLAGFYEGEGSIDCSHRSGGRRYLKFSIGSSDLDVLERCQTVFGGRINMTHPGGEHRKRFWTWSVSASAHAYALAIAIWGHLGQRRRGQVSSAVKQWISCGVRPSRHKYVWDDNDSDWFWQHIDRTGDCWAGPNAPEAEGYSMMSYVRGERSHKAAVHRLAWELTYGARAWRLVNTCGNSGCVRPDHWRESPGNRRAKNPGETAMRSERAAPEGTALSHALEA